MIKLTEFAAKKVIEIAKEEGFPPMIRAKVMGGGCAGFTNDLSFTEDVSDMDEVFETFGVSLVIDPVSLQYLDNTEIDYTEDKLGSSGFKFNNPNATGSCGCGKSFSA